MILSEATSTGASTCEPPGHDNGAAGALRAARGAWWVLVAVQLLLCLWFFSFTADDAYIIARYGRNLAEGQGLVFNPGEPVSALTSPLAAILEAGLLRVFGGIVLPYKVVCVLLMLLTGGLLWRALRDQPAGLVLGGALVMSSPFLALWTVGGMETPLLLFLLTLATLRYLDRHNPESSGSRQVAFSMLLGLAFLARHDAALFGGAMALAWAVEDRRAAVRLLLPGALMAGAWLAFAWSTYGDPLPTSFYVKTPGLFWHDVKQNLKYLAQFVAFSGFGLAGLWILCRGRLAGRKAVAEARSAGRRHPGLYVGLGLLAGYAMLAATKHMMFSYRLLVPYLPAMALAAVELLPRPTVDGAIDGSRREAAHGRVLRFLPVVFAAIVSVHLILAWQIDRVSLNPGWVGEYRKLSRREYVDGFAAACREAAGEIRLHWARQPKATRRRLRLATFAAGITPYYLPEAYVLERLVSYRHGTPFELGKAAAEADYVMLLTPEHGPADEQIAPALLRRLQPVAKCVFPFDGRENTLHVLFNPAPRPPAMGNPR
jgi:hypothetical protein